MGAAALDLDERRETEHADDQRGQHERVAEAAVTGADQAEGQPGQSDRREHGPSHVELAGRGLVAGLRDVPQGDQDGDRRDRAG